MVDDDNEGGYASAGERGLWEISVSYSQVRPESKPSIKKSF